MNDRALELEGQILDRLRSLGRTSQEVAASLRRMGIVGVPEDRLNCPLSRVLQSLLYGESVSFDATGYTVTDAAGRTLLDAPMSEPLRDFRRDFDAGNFPELLDEDYTGQKESFAVRNVA